MPGDPDLDADVDGLTVTSVVAVAETREVLIRLVDGFGRFVDSGTGEMTHFPPGDPDARVSTADVKLRLPTMPDDVWASYIGQLERWRDEARPLRMTAAPGKVTLLIGGRDDLLPMPRRADPLEQDAGTGG
jgi:hypothetical protein